MPSFTILPSRSYIPSDNPVNRTKGTVGATSGSTTVSITSVDPSIVSYINSVRSSRIVAVSGSGIPAGGTVSAASGSTLTLSYGYNVSTSAGTLNWIEWYFNDAPNSRQQFITKLYTTGSVTLDYIDVDGTRGTLSGITGTNQFDLTVARTLSTTSGTILGFSNGNAL